MDINHEIFKLRIKAILSEKNMTSKELAERMGKAPQYVSNIINGGKGVSISTLIEVAKTLNVEFRELFASPEKVKGEDLTALIQYKGEFYKATTLDELEKIVAEIKEKSK